jgi:hypothetical protein
MAGYFEVQIKEGLVSSLTCPEEKCDSQALPNQVGIYPRCSHQWINLGLIQIAITLGTVFY